MPKISVITATNLQPRRLAWLGELNEQLSLPGVQHVIVVDGTKTETPQWSADVIFTGRPLGQALARNIGLLHATGDYITSADDDDRVPPEGLFARSAELDANPSIGWCAGRMANIDDASQLIDHWDCPAQPGHYSPGQVHALWSDPAGEFPMSPQALMVRAELLRSVGGWGGLPQGEDFSMVMAVTGASPGVVLPQTVYEYRNHIGQMVRQEGFDDLELDIRKICFERGRLCA